jgi:hypothetical protein
MPEFKLNPLKVVGAILALIAFILTSITQRQDIDDAVDRRLDELLASDEEELEETPDETV